MALLATNRFHGDGTTTSYEFNFVGKYIARTHVKVYQEDNATKVRTYVSINDSNFLNDTTLRGLPVTPVGSTLVIYRETPKPPLVDFVNGSRFTEYNLDLVARQGLFVAMEAMDATDAVATDAREQLLAAISVVSALADDATAAASDATASASASTAKAAEAVASATLSYQYMTDAKAAADAVGPVKFYDTKAQADGTIGTTADGSIIEVSQDETRAGARTRYKVQAGALVFMVNLDQLRLDLAAPFGAERVGYLPAGTGAKARTAQDKLRESVSVKDFGAVGDGVADDTASIQAALDHVNEQGGGAVYLPPGRYRKSGTSPTLMMYSNTTLCGAGSASVIFHDDRPTDPRIDMLRVSTNSTDVSFLDFKIEGTVRLYTTETNQKQTIIGTGINGLSIRGVHFEALRYMATSFSYARNVIVEGCLFREVLRDGARFTHSQNVIITGNRFVNVADDAVALHSVDSDSAVGGSMDFSTVPVGDGFIVSANVFEASQGICVLGAKNLTISGNTMRRMMRSPIRIANTSTLPEGNTPMFAINIVGNTFLDTIAKFNTSRSDYVISISVRDRTRGSLPSQPGVASSVFPYSWANNIDADGSVGVGAWAVKIADNVIARTLPSGGSYSAYGYGQLLDRQGGSFGPGYYDPVMTEDSFATTAVAFEGPVRGLLVDSNIISGGGVDKDVIAIRSLSNGTVQEAVVISNNIITDCPGVGIRFDATTALSRYVVVSGNTLDLDPLFRHHGHAADNTWLANGSAYALAVGNTHRSGKVVGNIFSHCSGVIDFPDSVEWGYLSNSVIWQPNGGLGLDGTATNRGIRYIPSAVSLSHVIYDGDPASGLFKSVKTVPSSSRSAMPTFGTYVYGTFVKASVPIIAGSAGSRYVVTGWVRLNTGSNHVLNTDWLELRNPTGT